MIKILKFRVEFFPYVLILIESSDALPFSASSHQRVMCEGYCTPHFFAPTLPPFKHSGGYSWAQPQLAPQRCSAATAITLATRFKFSPWAAPHTSGGTQCYCQDPAAAGSKRSQSRTVCRIAHQLNALIAFGLAPCASLHTVQMHALPKQPSMPSIVSRLTGNTPGAWSNTHC